MQPQRASDGNEPEKKKGFIGGATADVIGIASSIAAGTVSAWVYIQRNAYKNMSSLGAFDDMKPVRKARFDEIEKHTLEGAISSSESARLVDELIEINEREATQRLHKMGIRGISGRWNILRSHQKLEALVFAAATGGVALGSVLPLMHNMMTAKTAEAEPAEKTPR